MSFELVTLKSGIKSLRCLQHQETFHPGIGPSVEAKILHVDQQRLVERCASVAALGKKFVIWDVGLGAAANALAALEALKSLQCEVELHSFDKVTAPLEFALAHAKELEYLAPYQGSLRCLIKERKIEFSPRLRWEFHLGDFREQLIEQRLPPPHAIFYDPYSPVGNPEMWTLEHFQLLRRSLSPEVPCLLSNYTRSTAVRVSLLLAGFHVGTGCIIGEKAETTLASNDLSLLEKPLGRPWLERVRHSTNAAPLRSVLYTKGQITPKDLRHLESCPQFIDQFIPGFAGHRSSC